MKKQNIDLIIRGFLYRTNWTPISTRRRRNPLYTVDFLKCYDRYMLLIEKLRVLYNVNLYFTTYDSTPDNHIRAIQNLMNPVDIFISPEKKSSQFTTTKTALSKLILNNYNNDNIKMLIRSDILVTDYFIDLVCKHNFIKNILYVLCKEKNKGDKVIDVFHVFYGDELLPKVQEYFSTTRIHAHHIHKKIYTHTLSINGAHNCQNTELCKEFYSIYH
jgi:hypothetical protein